MLNRLIVLLATISLVTAENRTCITNESFKECGTACEPSCENPKPEICTEQCVSGCQCDDGFYRNSNKECVKLEECKTISTKCAANETFTDCHNSCTEKKCPREFPLQILCILSCRPGCRCSPGHARNTEGNCVKQVDCPKIDGLPTSTSASVSTENPCNQVDCRSGLICELKNGQPTCVKAKRSVPKIAEPVETNPCHWTKCSAGKKCVLRQVMCIRAPCNPIAECVEESRPTRESKCPSNEEMVQCKSACMEKKCDQTGELICTLECRGPGCGCKAGFFRNKTGSCVTQRECGTQPK